ncbi:aminodeoxychorismate synthase component I [Streptomyces sp. NPDC088116]|uniref:aminodeoxychorismate synthase component I n=1 Tax=Streptomyces sp. NPDC088116 TaxID=3365825 RepID=UPI0037F2BBEB
MRTLLVDNYDSYTYNLCQLIAEVYGVEPTVVRNDDPEWGGLDLRRFDCAVVSPGPGRPHAHRDFGHSRDLLRRAELPTLGVCLGHQGIGLLGGARVESAPEPRHGHLTTVEHTGEGLFAGIPQRFTAVRYHSLCVAEPIPAELEAMAWAEDGVIMGLRHRELPLWGVQFHPESISTEYGAELVSNFRELALGSRRHTVSRTRPGARPEEGRAPGAERSSTEPNPTESRSTGLRLHTRRIDRHIDTEAAFLALHGASDRAFWLDSALVEEGLSRFSFLGDAEGAGGEVLTYRLGDGAVIVEPSGGIPYLQSGDVFDVLRDRLERRVEGADELPFDFTGGYVGYFGYELKADTGSTAAHRAPTPDAVWLRVNRFVAVDHAEGRTYVVAVAGEGESAAALSWADRTLARLAGLPDAAPGAPTSKDVTAPPVPARPDTARMLARPRERYLADVEECRRQLRAGESYEICLTNSVRLPAPADDLAYYRRLRRLNPAPYSALLCLGELTVFSSSPERFLRLGRDGVVESKPIKGTARRDPDPGTDEALRDSLRTDAKTRAENLMIVDLLRNDLGRVCEVGSVTVPAFMATESYATVHQLVSTVRGVLRADTGAIDCVRACFPGGSMTGAPKLRTLEIIDSLEGQARGVYSGALGYLGFSGSADLNIVIRTAVRWRDELTVGAGGAIVLDSDPVAEYDEMLLKAEATLRALPLPPAGAAQQTPAATPTHSLAPAPAPVAGPAPASRVALPRLADDSR